MRPTSGIVVVAILASHVGTADAVHVRPDFAPDFVVLDAGERYERTTRLSTDRSARYRITVVGAYTYNGGFNYGDCGHWDSEGEPGWEPAKNLIVDGVVSPCTAMPFHTSHVYCWTQLGTGSRLRFVLWSGNGPDDHGKLVVSVQREPVAPPLPDEDLCASGIP